MDEERILNERLECVSLTRSSCSPAGWPSLYAAQERVHARPFRPFPPFPSPARCALADVRRSPSPDANEINLTG
ncbi:hypothetical protein PUN28_001237 [Cardiocondyla obscurior]|uniref:Uncharacterized protein n=1 Tax=Cardiocondyla obscurior TaxID=286306 RepID=A0AAW2H3X5_9HYME